MASLNAGWFPDSNRVAFSVEAGTCVVDVGTGEEHIIKGWREPVIDPTGEVLLVRSLATGDERFRLVAPDGSVLRDDLEIPGLLYDVLALLENNLVIYEGLPTEGTTANCPGSSRRSGR